MSDPAGERAPTASVVIAAWSAAAFIAGAVRSALAQTLDDLEVIVVDDASPDATAAAARQVAPNDPRLRVIRLETNSGPGGARNAGFAAARGRWICVLDSDDAYAPNRLERLVAFAEQESADLAADALTVVRDPAPSAQGTVFAAQALASPVRLAAYVRDNRLFSGKSGGSGYLKPIFRRAFIERHGLRYRTDMRVAEDFAFVAEALAHGARFVLSTEPGYRYLVRDGSISHRLTSAHVARMIAADDAFRAAFWGRLPPPDRAALDARRKSLHTALAFQEAIEALKGRQVFRAAGAIARRPAAAALFSQPILARVRRALGRNASARAVDG